MAVMTLSTASRDAFAASALHLVWIAWISANCSGNGFFDARTSSISLFPSLQCRSTGSANSRWRQRRY